MITDVQRFSLNDGPGIRTSVFFKGCSLACAWCHNPESLSEKPQLLVYPTRCMGCGHCVRICPTGARILSGDGLRFDRAQCTGCGACADVCFSGALALSGAELSCGEIMRQVLQDASYYKNSGGGITLSGGEALMQPGLCIELLAACKEQGIHTAIETCLNVPFETLEHVLPYLDLIMLDVKLLDDAQHKRWTGVGNARILSNLSRLSEKDIPLIIRTPVIPGVNDEEAIIASIARHIAPFESLLYYELLNFNPLGEGKYEALDKVNAFAGARPLSGERIESLHAAAHAVAPSLDIRIG